ncbi:transcription-repair coupling factor [Longilinea arvoryzae]|uniref:Transcription-repair-coupling factor n=1 Tax=Longilinea arvoryzae TaxID=360412 RepID=A0A0S7BM66_9CHLR|nr:transcription-repair coupling factor [Longilinea arvoryzae]GAP15083.1 transcription-repair coupling factor [Longilinea arvoryzae]
MLDAIRKLPAYQALVDNLKAGAQLPGLGLMRAARLPLAAALYQDLQQPLVLVTDRPQHALTLLDEVSFWARNAPRFYFSEPTPLFYEQAAWGDNTRRDRLQALTALAVYHLVGSSKPDVPPIVVTTVRALMTRTLPRRDFIKASRTIKINQSLPPDELARSWVAIGYQAADIVLEPGQFSRRGGILDIWPPAEPLPVRIEFFGDEIDLLRRFDPASQRTVAKLDQLLVTPARELLPGRAVGILPAGREVDEFYIPVVHPAVSSLLDYLPKGALTLVDDMDLLQSQAVEIEEQAVRLRAESITEGTLSETYPIPYLSWSEVIDSLTGHIWLQLGHAGEAEPSELSSAFIPGPRFGGRLRQLVEHIEDLCRKGEPSWVISRQVSRLRELWNERPNEAGSDLSPEFIEGTLTEGWSLNLPAGGQLHLLTDAEIFGWERPQPRVRARMQAEAPEAVYTDLKPGDWVVHIDYGIGRFAGLVKRTLEGIEREFLCVEYDGGDQLYVPVHQADRLSRYVGPEAEPPSPTRLGTPEWTNTKQKVREEVLQVARELLDLYASRQVARGFSFSQDTPWQKELEASFPYVETEDQNKAIQAVKKDMETARPMDRLLCGDVGYGKTEVALRAAFKAVMDGKQVAVLVPTTVLAQQHFETFRQRLAAYPVHVEMLSRFRTSREQDEILLKLAAGELDIIIGTHRLIQPDVEFKDLGLVIIDEEQRFGVAHKEHFKKLRTEVDVLTLTATPIPRTLYLALTGARDISQINTPPAERLPIITHIGPYSPRLARQAILREMERGGQVFFVHNRVQTISAMEKHLNKLVPEARIGIAHGQMQEQGLSQVMTQFTKGEIDVLLCTSIIESGLDIPNANTLIVDRGDTFGLAQLYQLRGRVGRGAQRAYAYFFRHRHKAPTPEGQERLEVIAENAQLGAGYSIAMRDLEMRGAGEMLGVRQSGYIASVGFHLYTRLLAQAVRQIRQVEKIPAAADTATLINAAAIRMAVTVDLPISVGIPADYVPDQNLRLSLYRRLADLQNEPEVQFMADEFIDRFGVLPEDVENLLYQMRVKLLAEKAGLASVTLENDQLVLRFPPLPDGFPARNLPNLGPQARAGKNAYWLSLNGDPDGWKELLIDTLRKVAENGDHPDR